MTQLIFEGAWTVNLGRLMYLKLIKYHGKAESSKKCSLGTVHLWNEYEFCQPSTRLPVTSCRTECIHLISIIIVLLGKWQLVFKDTAPLWFDLIKLPRNCKNSSIPRPIRELHYKHLHKASGQVLSFCRIMTAAFYSMCNVQLILQAKCFNSDLMPYITFILFA